MWRRSFLIGDYGWVELEDGTRLPNLCGLCSEHHWEITENRAEIQWLDHDYWWYVPGHYKYPLMPSPLDGAYGSGSVPPSAPTVGSVEPGEEEKEMASPQPISPGSTCPLCLRRIPHPQKETSPKTKTFSYRVPVDDAETHDEILSAAAEHLGIYEQPHWRWQLATMGAALILQGHGDV